MTASLPVTFSAPLVTTTTGATLSTSTRQTAPTLERVVDTIAVFPNSPSSESPSVGRSHDVRAVEAKLFPEVVRKVNHCDLCVARGHCNLKAGKFKYEWLSLRAKKKRKNNNSAFDFDAGLWWLTYIEDKGIFVFCA